MDGCRTGPRSASAPARLANNWPPQADRHLSPEVMARLRTGNLEPEAIRRELLPHLAAHCPACREQIAELRRLMSEAGHWDAEVAVTEWREAPEVWNRLAALPYAEQLRAVEAEETYHTWGLCRLLERLSAVAAPEEPLRAARLANLSVRISSHLGNAYGPESVRDLRALALGRLAEARRRLGELASAQDAIDAGEMERLAGTGDPAIAAELQALAERLRCDEQRLANAVDGPGDAR
jgi:hypothetical protein